MMRNEPDLPGLYEMVALDRAPSAKAHAELLAAAGAEEGTLVWVREQTQGAGRAGKCWISGERNLHCAVILRPDEPFEACCELSLLACVCAGQAITVVGEPMEELRFGWPNDVYLNRGKVGGVHLSGEIDARGRVPWMVLALDLNTFEHPCALGFAAASLRGEGFEVHDRIVLLEAFARELLAWLNRWAGEGLAPVRKAWLWRGGWTDAPHSVEHGGRAWRGDFHGLEEDGALRLRTEEGTVTLDLAGFYRGEFRAAGAEARTS